MPLLDLGNKLRISSNGRTPGIALPSGNLQEAVMRKAYQNAGLDFAETDYVECHGTGTPVGDPIEVDAVGRCFFRPKGQAPLLIGSVSDNHINGSSSKYLTENRSKQTLDIVKQPAGLHLS